MAKFPFPLKYKITFFENSMSRAVLRSATRRASILCYDVTRDNSVCVLSPGVKSPWHSPIKRKVFAHRAGTQY